MIWKLLSLLAPLGLALAAWGWREVIRARREAKLHWIFVHQLLHDREQERSRIAGELHSSLGQNLLVIKNRAEMGLIASGDNPVVRDQLTEISALCSQTIAESRQLAHGLRPHYLAEIGLSGALDAMIDRVASASSIQFKRRLEQVDDVFDADAAINVYRIVQEAINNVLKHSQAKNAAVELIRDLREVRLMIEDDGRGIRPPASNGHLRSGLGLSEIRERSRILGAEFKTEDRPGGGARLTVRIPIRESAS